MSISTTTDNFFFDKWHTQYFDQTEEPAYSDTLNGKKINKISISKYQNITLTIPIKRLTGGEVK